MTIYGTPGGTPLNTSGFQGSAPGNPVQASLQTSQPGVGLFPPNSNNLSGDTVLAAASRGAVPVNAIPAGYDIGSPCGTLMTIEATGGASGTCQSGSNASLNTMNISANGGGGPGPICQSNAPAPAAAAGSGAQSQLPHQFPAASATYAAAFGG